MIAQEIVSYMKYLKNLRIRNIKLTLVAGVFALLSYGVNAQDGEALFNANCASCHKPDKDYVGPALKGAKQRWEENSSLDNFYAWVKNSQAVIKSGDSYANKLFKDWNKSIMTNQMVSNEEIDAIVDYVENYSPAVAVSGGDGGGGAATAGGEEGDASGAPSWIWWVMVALFLITTFSLISVKRQLTNATREQDGLEPLPDASYFQSFKEWSWKNRGIVGVASFILILIIGVQLIWVLLGVGVQDGYKPTQPIEFNHSIHAGDNEISCVYCHNSVEKSKSAGIPTVNVCMNCHKAVAGNDETKQEKISKIYDAANFDPEQLKYLGEEGTEPIKWVKVHNLPDHVYFNHSQHVKVGGIECQQCHGDMTKETVGKVQTIEDLNKVEGNIQLTRPTLTMGWCIECHGEVGIDVQGNTAYYEEIHKRLLKDKKLYKKYIEDEKISVSELGGWECAKCHY